jgi:hypothetical protein
VREARGHAIERRGRHDRHAPAHCRERLGTRAPFAGSKFACNSKSNAASSICRSVSSAALNVRVPSSRAADRRAGFAAFDVGRNQRQYFGPPDEILHELARQLDRIPGDAVDTGDARIGDAREHVMQAVPELVEQRRHLVVGQQ